MNWGHRVHQRGRSDEDYHRDACTATRCHAMECQKKKNLRHDINARKLFWFKTWIEKLVFLELIPFLGPLYLIKVTPKNAIRSIDLCPRHASRNLVLATYLKFWYCSGMLLSSVCLRLSDDKFWENNVLTCPAGYSYYSTNHNDGVEDYFNQTDNGEF